MRSVLVGTTSPASASFRGLPLLLAAYPHSCSILSEIRRRAPVVGLFSEPMIGRMGGCPTPTTRLRLRPSPTIGSAPPPGIASVVRQLLVSGQEPARTGLVLSSWGHPDESGRKGLQPGCVSGTTRKERTEQGRILKDAAVSYRSALRQEEVLDVTFGLSSSGCR